MPGRTVDLYPTDGMGGPLCGPSTCPDFPAMWSFSYGGAAVPAGELSLQTGPAIPPPTITGNPAYIRIGHLPTP